MSTDTREAPNVWRNLYRRAINEAGGLTNYVEDRPELRSAERRIAKIEEDARAALATQPAQPSTLVERSDAEILVLADKLFPMWREDIQPQFVLRLARAVLADSRVPAAQPSAQGVPYAWVQHFPGFPSRLFFIKDDGDPNGRAWAPAVTWEYLYKHPASQPSAQGETVAWLVEWKAHGHGPQWWGFNHTPGKNATWCSDANNAIRFARKEDAERMRLHVIAVAGLTGMHSYERSVSVTEHLW